MKLGIIGAMDIEVETLISNLTDSQEYTIAKRKFFIGKISGLDVVIVQSGIGLVNAAITTQILINNFNVNYIINTGIAGGLGKDVKINDVVISTDCVEYGMNAGYFGYPIGQIPGMKTYSFKASEKLIDIIKSLDLNTNIHFGRILSADKFVADSEVKDKLLKDFNGMCVEMEGAAIAHTCYENNVEFCIIRSISDNADDDATCDYETFFMDAANFSENLVLKLIEKLK